MENSTHLKFTCTIDYVQMNDIIPKGLQTTKGGEGMYNIWSAPCMDIMDKIPINYDTTIRFGLIGIEQGLINRRRRERTCNYVTHQN